VTCPRGAFTDSKPHTQRDMAAVEIMPVIPERRPREIIDVDSLDDDEIRASQLPLRRRRLYDDAEVEYVGSRNARAAHDIIHDHRMSFLDSTLDRIH
jgi:hypothetical protein